MLPYYLYKKVIPAVF